MDKRYKFIRSKNLFEGLEDYKMAPYFRLKHHLIGYPIQSSLFNDEKLGSGMGLRTKEGDFFEFIGRGMYGGTKKLSYNQPIEDNGHIITIQPDITDKKKGILHEVKGIQKSNHLKLSDEQIAKYLLLQSKQYFPNPPTIRYTIFGHGIKKMQDTYKNKGIEDLVFGLSDSVRYSVSLPFSLIFEFYFQDDKKSLENKKYTSRHNNELTYDTMTKVHCNVFNDFIAYPEKTIEEMGFNKERFKIEKRRFPKSFKINNFSINPFPMLFIYDKEYSSFVSGLSEKINSNEIVAERIHNATKGLIGERPILDLENIPFELIPTEEDAPF